MMPGMIKRVDVLPVVCRRSRLIKLLLSAIIKVHLVSNVLRRQKAHPQRG